jgi:hypothetical protein
MQLKLAVAAMLAALHCLAANANSEDAFKRCVTIKDITLTIAEQADKGVPRAAMKSRVSDSSMHDLVDFVYDFRGAKTNQQIAASQMDNCLRLSNVKPGRR